MRGLVRWLVAMSVLLSSGCATFESGDVPLTTDWPPPAGLRRAIDVRVVGLPEKFRAGWLGGAERVLQDWRRHDCPLEPGQEVEDWTLTLQFEHSRQDLWLTRVWMGVCAMTAGVVPARTEQCFAVRAVMRDARGEQVGQAVERNVSAATWVGWLPLFALPFAGGGLGELVRDTMRSVVDEGAANGWDG